MDPENDDDYVAEYDANGRPLKNYKPRRHPFKEWGERAFRRRYRLTKDVAREVCNHFIEWTPYEWLPYAGAIPLEDRFCLGLRYLATGANYTPVSETQGVSKSTVTRCLDHVLDYFVDQHRNYIKWPENHYELLQAAASWEENVTGLPRCIGAIDGTHIPILKPSIHEPVYVNRKGYHSINCMVICDSEQRIIHVDPTFPGSVGDARVYNESEIRDLSDAYGLDDYFLLGDSGYPLRKNLFTPVREPLTHPQRMYNVWHRGCRHIIERTIGVWKQRWRCLDSSAGYLYHEPGKCGDIAIATACLHNICINNNIPMDQDQHYDGFHPIRPMLPQPQQVVGGEEHLQARREFINAFF